ncbi:hypothetical protein [Glaesserella sp.]|uniref:hypothetical protein n=1 Tax=Glaesserella sp. TaxID=2094731 RepID=UPI0035A199D0
MNQDYKLPPRKWYTLEQAIKRIKQLTGEELEIADLIHFWNIAKLELCVDCSLYPVVANIGNSQYKQSNYFECLTPTALENYQNNDLLAIHKFDKPIIKGIQFFNQIEIRNAIIAKNDKDPEFKNKMNIQGFLSILKDERIISSEEEKLSTGEKISIFNLFLATPKETSEDRERVIFFLDIIGKAKISKDDLRILHSDLMDFIENKSNPPQIENKPHPKTLNAQAEFIRNLLIMFYDETTANNIRKELDNPNSEIRQDFERKGLQTPSGKTVDRWINQP